MMINFFADALRQALREKGLNQAQLAEFLGIEPPYISRWLRGAYPRLDLMQDVLTRLGWDLDRARPEYDPVVDAVKKVRHELIESGPMVVAEDGPSGGVSPEDFEKVIDEFVHLRRSQKDSIPKVEGAIRLNQDEFEVAFERPAGYDLSKLDAVIPHFANSSHRPLKALLLDRSTTAFGAGEDILAFVRDYKTTDNIPDGTEVVVECPESGRTCLRRLHVMDDPQGKKKTPVMMFVPLTGRGGVMLRKADGPKITHVVEGWWKPSRLALGIR